MSNNSLQLLNQISSFVHKIENDLASKIVKIVILKSSRGCTEHRDVYYTNICGKVSHYTSNGVSSPFIDGVKPLVRKIQNGFGLFHGVFGKKCNLLTCSTGRCTLFRGANSTKDVAEMIDHTLLPQVIGPSYIHMLVASSRISKPIYATKNKAFLNAILSDRRWTSHMQMLSEERSYMVSFKIEKMDRAWLESICNAEAAATVNNLLININFKGSINYFLSILPTTPFQINLEHQYTAIFRVFHNTILNSS